MPRDLIICTPRVSSDGDMHRAEAMIDGAPLWFTTRDAPLQARPEAWGTCLLIPALHRRRRLRIDAPVCPTWAAGVDRALELTSRWWRHSVGWPILETAPLAAATRPLARLGAPDERERVGGSGLCFTGGVDSFFSLLRYPGRLDALVHLTHAGCRAPHEEPLRQIAAERGLRLIFVQSNLKQHPAFRGAGWGRTHGAALCALGHLLSDALGTLVLSSSYPCAFAPPWGSHHQLDPLWSSARLEVVHFGATHWRTQKLFEIAHEPIVQRHLHPCSKRGERLNCCRCEKCLRTQLVLLTCGQLDRFKVFAGADTLARQADGISRIPIAGLWCVYERLLEAGLPGDVAAAVRRLLARSRRSTEKRSWAGAALRLLGLGRRSARVA